MLEEVIEKKRKEMVKLAYSTGFNSKKTVQCSQELDKLLNLLQVGLKHTGTKKIKVYFAL
ncbi:MAG: aspartyl-phosphate phosphatase Spo0E family protein [Bacillaceae bacterium]|nr:aspartyl-phosphate phosphatase Spo0E family protein [Bacillaceae bacterium]